MRCAKCQKLYDEAVRGRLSERLDRKVRQHVASCPTCAVVWQENETLRRLVCDASEPVRVPDAAAFRSMARRAVARIESERAVEPAARPGWGEVLAPALRGRRLAAGALRATAVLAVGIVIGAVLTRNPQDAERTEARGHAPTGLTMEPQETPVMLASQPGSSATPTPAVEVVSTQRSPDLPLTEPIIPPPDVPSAQQLSTEESNPPTGLVAKRPVVDPVVLANAVDRAVTFFEKLPPTDEVEQLRRIRSASSQLESEVVLRRLQSLKWQLVRDGQSEYIPDFQRIERVLKEMAAVSPRAEATEDFAYLDTYNEACSAWSAKDYIKAIELFRKVIVQGRGSYLAALAKFHVGNLNYEVFHDYRKAFADYNEFLKETPDRYLSESMLTQARERIDRMAGNAVDNYEPLRLFDRTETAKSPTETATFCARLLRRYPESPLVPKAIDVLARIVRQNLDDEALAERVVEELVQFQGNNADHRFSLYADLAVAEIGYYRTKDQKQAELDYSRILEKVEEGSDLAVTVRERLAQLDRGF